MFVIKGALGVFSGEEVKIRLTDGISAPLQPESPGQRLADPHEAALHVLEVDRVRQHVHQSLQVRALLVAQLVGAPAADRHLDGVGYGIAGHVARHQVGLRALLDVADAERLFRRAGEHDNGGALRYGQGLLDRFRCGGILQAQAQQDNVDTPLLQAGQPCCQMVGALALKPGDGLLAQPVPQQGRMARISLDQEHLNDILRHRSTSVSRGRRVWRKSRLCRQYSRCRQHVYREELRE